ncbi:MAG: DUF4340 domain-containing protein [Clostridia bacterium]|nr:DUF4340 domain-containing protein [Clostridia bacterium]
MKKQTVVIIWAAALLLLVVSCFGIYYFYDAVNTRGNSNKNIEVFTCLPDSITEYSVADKNGEYTLEKIGDEWRVDDKSVNNLNAEKVKKLMHSASGIKAVGTVGKKELSKFDTADKRRLEIKVASGTDDEDIEIEFLGASGGLCAFRIEDDRKTYLMYESMRDILTPSLNSLRVTEVFEGLAQSETFPDYYKYTDYDGAVVEVRTKTAAELAKSKNNRYIMEKPYKKEVSDEAFEQQIAVKIPALQAADFIKAPQNMEEIGLDEKSRAELNFKWDGKTQTLYLGSNNGGMVYANKKGTDAVFTINSSLLEFIQIDPFFILEDSVLKTDTDSIQSVIVKANGEVYNITSTNRKGENPQFYVNGKAASEDVFEKVIDKLDDIKFLSELTSVPKDTKDIVVTVNYNNTAGSQTITLSRLADKNYAAFIDGKAEFAVNGKAADELLEELKNAVKNPMKTD